MVFQLERPSPTQPYIKGLLDPCTNSLAAPNIPAEVLYDKKACVFYLPPAQPGAGCAQQLACSKRAHYMHGRTLLCKVTD